MYTRISKLDFTILKWMIKAINTWSRCPRLAYIASNNFLLSARQSEHVEIKCQWGYE